MNKTILKITTLSLLAFSFAGCQRIETGEVGLRVDMSKQTLSGELLPGSFNQTLIGSVMTFPVRDVAVIVENKTPLTQDNSSLSDFDATLIYSINPTSVSDLWTKKSRSFHTYSDETHDWYLMHQFMETALNNAAYKSVRKYKALEAADNRKNIEVEIKSVVDDLLKEEGLSQAITVTMVQVRNILPAADIIASANSVVKAQNDLRAKTVEVETAKKEAERIAALNSNAKASEYMNAQSQFEIAKAVANGKVNTIVIPYDFKGMVNIKN